MGIELSLCTNTSNFYAGMRIGRIIIVYQFIVPISFERYLLKPLILDYTYTSYLNNFYKKDKKFC